MTLPGCTTGNYYPTNDHPAKIRNARVIQYSDGSEQHQLLLQNPGSLFKAWQTVTAREYRKCQVKEYFPTCAKEKE